MRLDSAGVQSTFTRLEVALKFINCMSNSATLNVYVIVENHSVGTIKSSVPGIGSVSTEIPMRTQRLTIQKLVLSQCHTEQKNQSHDCTTVANDCLNQPLTLTVCY